MSACNMRPTLLATPLQPCDQGIIALTKRAYKKQVRYILIEEIDSTLEDVNAPNAVNLGRKINVLHAMQMWKSAWDSVSKEDISNYWKKSKLKEW